MFKTRFGGFFVGKYWNSGDDFSLEIYGSLSNSVSFYFLLIVSLRKTHENKIGRKFYKNCLHAHTLEWVSSILASVSWSCWYNSAILLKDHYRGAVLHKLSAWNRLFWMPSISASVSWTAEITSWYFRKNFARKDSYLNCLHGCTMKWMPSILATVWFYRWCTFAIYRENHYRGRVLLQLSTRDHLPRVSSILASVDCDYGVSFRFPPRNPNR